MGKRTGSVTPPARKPVAPHNLMYLLLSLLPKEDLGVSSQQQTHRLCEQMCKVRREKLALLAVWVHLFAMMESEVWLQLPDSCVDGCVNHTCGSKLFSQYPSLRMQAVPSWSLPGPFLGVAETRVGEREGRKDPKCATVLLPAFLSPDNGNNSLVVGATVGLPLPDGHRHSGSPGQPEREAWLSEWKETSGL